jgi:hypothetical protein
MIRAEIGDSKLCACATRHAQEQLLSAIVLRSTWQGEGFAAPRCIPTRLPHAAVETLPVSTPSGMRDDVAHCSPAVCP